MIERIKNRFEKIIIPFYNKDTEEILFEQKIKAIAFWAGEKKFFVSHDGYLKIVNQSIDNYLSSIKDVIKGVIWK